MFNINDESLVLFGEKLKQLRLEKKVSTKNLSDKTGIDIATLNRIEQGFIKKINPLILNELAKYFNLNVLYFYSLLGYINNEEILNYSNLLIENNYTSSDDFGVPLINDFNSFDDISHKNRKIYLPFPESSKENLFGYYLDEFTAIIFSHTSQIKNDDFGIFKINNNFIISKYFEKNNFIFLTDMLETNEKYIIEFDKIIVIGKILYKIKRKF